MDHHRAVAGTTPQDIAAAHHLDQQIEGKYGVRYLTYWFDKDNGGLFCLAEAPSKEMAVRVHAEAHGMVAEELIEVTPGDVNAFLGRTADPPITPISDSAFRTIVFTDIVGSTPSTQRLGDDAAMIIVREHDNVVRKALNEHEGSEIKHTGDGIMASFASVAKALDFSITVQRSLQERNLGKESYAVHLRVGLNAGEPVCEGGDLFGSAVQLARRICDAGDAGSILTSNVIRELSAGKNFTFKDRGEAALKGFDDPVRLHELHWQPK
jgi:class 3 adenylate cyclase